MSDALGEDCEFGLSALGCCAGFETPDDGERVAPAIGFRRERKRIEKIDAAAGSENRGEIQGSRKNTDDGGRPSTTRTGSEGVQPQEPR